MSIAPNLFWDPKIAGRAGAGGGPLGGGSAAQSESKC